MVYQQAGDGSYQPAQPLGWQGSGIDWEVQREGDGLVAHGYDEDVLVAVVRAKTKRGLQRAMRKATKSA